MGRLTFHAVTDFGDLGETPNPIDLLTKIGRNADKRLTAQAESWEKLTALWKDGGTAIEAAGLGPRDRRYVDISFSQRRRCSS